MSRNTLFAGGNVPAAKKPPNTFDLYEMLLRETQGAPEGWRAASFSCLENDAPKGFVKVVGAVYPAVSDGVPQWHKRDRSTERTYFVELSKFNDFRKSKAAAEGVCAECWGQGVICIGWTREAGKKFKICPACRDANATSIEQAADVLNVTTAYVVGLVAAGELTMESGGIAPEALAEYKRKSDVVRRKALEELVDQAQELGMGY